MRLVALTEVLPGAPVSNAQLAARFDLHADWLETMTGNVSRHFCGDGTDGIPSNTGELATLAGGRAMAEAGVGPGDVDFVILATASPDNLMPATVNTVADRLGINGVPTLQLTSGCAGALQGLFTARALLASGLRRGLVIGADCCAKMFPQAADLRGMKPAEIVNLALFGDGAGAAVVDADTSGPGLVVEAMLLRTIGMGRPPAQTVRWYGADGAPIIGERRGMPVRQPMAEEDYKAIEAHVPTVAAAILDELLETTGWALPEVGHVLTPQLNGLMTEKIRAHLAVSPDQAVSCVSTTGNNGNALPFVQLHRAVQRLSAPGAPACDDRVLVATVESSKWVMAGLALRYQPHEVRHVA